MIDRVRGRGAFTELSRRGRRARSGVLSVVALPDPGAVRPAVAYAVGRRVGPAVRRNLVRRRLREAVRALDRQGRLAPGTYLLRAGPGAADTAYVVLAAHVERLVGSARMEDASESADRTP